MTIAVWLGTAPPARTIRWLDGALHAAMKLAKGDEPLLAVAAGDPTWLDLAADRAGRAGVPAAGISINLQLDYLGWAQVMAAVARQINARIVIVDEASRAERFPEVAALAELLEAAQLTHVVSLAPDGKDVHATRVHGTMLHSVRISGTAVIGVRIPGAPIEEYPTPTPSASMRRLDLNSLGLDPVVLGHRALPPRSTQEPRRTLERVAEHLAVHVVPRRGGAY